ncbi:MAG: aspartate/glutamate racemase family protein [Desulfococcaceae bacterium]|jgi:glutamate racemase|nr:aspartate/glutamate racemase family protein [Desulfococcaceae bacterium]
MIGLLDSGTGGLCAARQIKETLPEYDFIYFGDTARSPCDNRSLPLLRKMALEGLDFLSQKGATVIVVTCHSISAVLDEKDSNFPLLNIVSPAAEQAAQQSRKGRIGLIGPRSLVESGIYEKKIRSIRPDAKLISVPAPLLMPLAEEAWIKHPETNRIVKKYLHYLKVRQTDTLIPASGFYAVLAKTIGQKAGKRVRCVDPAFAVCDHLKSYLNNHPDLLASLPQNGTGRYYVSDLNAFYQKTAKIMFGKNIFLEDAGKYDSF